MILAIACLAFATNDVVPEHRTVQFAPVPEDNPDWCPANTGRATISGVSQCLVVINLHAVAAAHLAAGGVVNELPIPDKWAARLKMYINFGIKLIPVWGSSINLLVNLFWPGGTKLSVWDAVKDQVGTLVDI